jgi:GH15 family glucan-1,4-alpha-glucosidase
VSHRPIADYALLSDCHSSALVSRDGSIDWLCFPRHDAPAVFCRLLDERAGHWSIRPAAYAQTNRRYLDRTLVLETTFRTGTGTAVLVDAMPVGTNERGHDLGASAPHALLRRVACMEGEVELVMEYAPRPEYGLVVPLMIPAPGGVSSRGGAAVLLLSSPLPLTIEDETASATFLLRAGEVIAFALQHRSSWEQAPEHWQPADIDRRIQDTVTAWQSWSAQHQNYDGRWSDLVMHSGRVLQGLSFYPTGAIIAAPTTSLPETVGGGRNWDYRYSWLRDAGFTLNALWVAACPDEVHRYFDFLAGASLTQVRRDVGLQIVFGVGGEHDLSERELAHLSGWRNSRPVRIGNGAWVQKQLDVYGELLDAAYRLRDRLAGLDIVTRSFLASLADAAATHWTEQDHGIWEVRGEQRDYLHSKLMCWVALDRAIGLADILQASERVPHWRRARSEIREAILDKGWNERIGAFTQAFGSDALDASCLMMPIVGFLPADDPRMRATIEAVAARLTDRQGLVYRYRTPDTLEGSEATFLLGTFWLVEALVLASELERARATFERAAAFANDVGLLSEEVDSGTRELLGNFPQAFSHAGLINAAWAIAQAESGYRPGPL